MTDEQNKNIAYNIAWYLHSYGIRDIVVSPGSRNAAIIDALANGPFCFKLHYVVDERQAAFVALGMAVASTRPVAMVCTSGTAMLNYAPALAEAYYSRIPLVAITADRPADVIDQRDSQTIRQAHALDEVVRRSVDIADDMPATYVRRLIQDALHATSDPIPGPVHINVRLHQPTAEFSGEAREPKLIYFSKPSEDTETELFNFGFGENCFGKKTLLSKTLLIIGGTRYSFEVQNALRGLKNNNRLKGLVTVAEVNTSNSTNTNLTAADLEKAILAGIDPDLIPDTVILMGGALVSGHIKKWLRELPESTHFINVGHDDTIVDTFGHINYIIDCQPDRFLTILEDIIPDSVDYIGRMSALRRHPSHPLFAKLEEAIGEHSINLHLSNGTTIRYASAMRLPSAIVWCNRGVSGIDGSTSTAIGTAILTNFSTLLVTGDMSAAYDISALSNPDIPPAFKMIIRANGGGDIFRRIAATRHLDIVEPYLAAMPLFPIAEIARAYGFDFAETDLADVTADDLRDFINLPRKAILLVNEPPTE